MTDRSNIRDVAARAGVSVKTVAGHAEKVSVEAGAVR